MKKIFVSNVGDLAEIQRASFYRFLSKGLSEELRNFPNPFVGKLLKPYNKGNKLCVCLDFPFIYHFPSSIKLKGPNLSVLDSLEDDQTYAIRFYVPSEYYFSDLENLDFKTFSSIGEKNIKVLTKYMRIKQDIFFGEIPLMTEEGTFIISGCERVVVSQIIRSPGIYFKKEFGTGRKVIYTATIISNQGSWTKFFLDEEKENLEEKKIQKEITKKKAKKDRIYIKINQIQSLESNYDDEDEELERIDSDNDKLFLFDFLRYFGMSYEEIFDSLKYPLLFSNQQVISANDLDQDFNNQTDLKINDENKFAKLDSIQKFQEKMSKIENYFLKDQSNSFSIGEIGRYKINKKLGLNIPKTITYLTSHDFIGIIDGLLELKYYDKQSDDIDDIRNKQIRSIGELLQNQFKIGCDRLKKNLSSLDNSLNIENLSGSEELDLEIEFESDEDTYDWIIDPRPITSSLKEFFKTSQLSQFMDQINPISDLTHKRRISVFGPNGLKRDNISTVIRDIHPSQYGRLCPVETPEGQNAGLISSIAMFARMDSLGSLETPYFFVEDGQIYSKKRPIFLNPEQESEVEIGFSDIFFQNQKDEKISQDYLSVKFKNLFQIKKKEKINFLTTSPLQIISLATCLIPFIEHDDANRALMGSNMQRQAVPLLYTESPIVGTGQEIAAILDSGMVIKTYSEGIIELANSNLIVVKDDFKQNIYYVLKKYSRSNQETSINQRPIVWPGEKVFSNQIIADGPSTNDGELSLGKNLTIAYMPWEGYNYEDAIVINEQLVINDYLTSVHIEEYETNVNSSLYGNDKLTANIPFLSKYIRRNLDRRTGVIKLGSYVKEDDILVGKLTPCEEDGSPAAKLIEALFGKKRENNRDTSLRVPHGIEGRVIGIKKLPTTINSEKKKKNINLITIPDFKEIKNKEIKKNLNSRLQIFLNKEIFDEKQVSLDKNFQNLKETFEENLQNEKQEEKIENLNDLDFVPYTIRISIAQIRKIQIGDKLSGRHGNKGVISRILPSQDMPYLPDGTPIDIIFNPLGVPSRMNVGQVFECLLGLAGENLGKRYKLSPFDETYGAEASRILVNQKLKEASTKKNINWLLSKNYPGKILLRDGRTGEFFDNPITVGKTYILKLIHLVEDKIHSRATGPYSMTTEQPLAGKSQRGGQRFGEMEVWALEAYGCSNILQELLTIKSDDIDGRNDMYESLLVRKDIPKPNPSMPEAFLVLVRELNALGLCFSFKKVNSNFHSREKFYQEEKDIFKQFENRLNLRALLLRKKTE